MKKNNIITLLLASLCTFAQQKIDGIAAVVDDEIVIQSDVKGQFKELKRRGLGVKDECETLEEILKEKLLIAEAKKDTLISINERVLKEQADELVSGAVNRFGGEKEALKLYGYTTLEEFKQYSLKALKDQSYSQQIQAKITKGIDGSPLEVHDFYNKFREQLPDVQEEVELSRIVIKPELTEKHKQELVDKLAEIKKKIENGSSFATMAIVNSEGPSSIDGGLLSNIRRGQLDKDFEAIVYNLDEGQISEPFETRFGFHIAMLVKRRGEILDLRHIILLEKPNESEMKKAKNLADTIKAKIERGELKFEDAVKEFSADKETRLNKGVVVDKAGNTRFVRINLPTNVYLEVTGKSEGELTSVFEDTIERNKKVYKIVRIDRVIPEHKINLKDDYERIKKFAVNKKKQEKIERWIKDHISENFIKIDDDYKTCKFHINWLSL